MPEPGSADRAPDSVGRADLWAMAAVVLAAVVLFSPALAGRVPLVRDFPGFTLPSRALFRSALLDGALPQWNPYVGLGVPVLAAPVHGALYPGHLLLLL